ncbi:MAG: NAD(+) diphosphatase [Gammaproteobacteria bacterium]|nr:NAD(+) diphosphatase [Gammaproteobacteria bacterium]
MPELYELPFVFSGPDMDRAVLQRHEYGPEQFTAADACFIPVFGKYNLLLADAITPMILELADARPLLAEALCTVLLGNIRKRPYVAIGLPEEGVRPAGDFKFTDLRPQFGMLSHHTLALLGYARAMVHWHLQNRYCGRCGAAMCGHHAGHELHCSRCSHVIYPQVNPAIIVLVIHRDRCLLGRKPGANRYSTLAGFLEPGESLEACVRREVFEETNIRVADMQYRASQPWPYPSALMLGFHANAETTEIRCNDGELADACWFTRSEIASGLASGNLAVSSPQSIAYALLREWFDAGGDSLDRLRTGDASAQGL